MIENGYVKKRKRKKLAAIAASVGTLGVSALVLVSFLGNYTGSFTISLNKGNVKISLSTKQNFGDGEGEDRENSGEVSSYLKVNNLKPFDQMTYTALPEDDLIDNENTTYISFDENKEKTMNFFKYTFFIKNMGSISTDYILTVRINESKPSVKGQYLDEVLRVMLYANDGYNNDAHERTVFAKQSVNKNKDEEGNETYNEYISYSPKQAKNAGVDFPGFATPFDSEDVVTSFPVKYFDQSNINRYTIVTWIEGYDPQGGDDAPEGASIKLGVEINAYENE